MPKKANPANRYVGKICAKHPDLNGLRLRVNSTCLQCGRDSSNSRRLRKMAEEGRAPAPRYNAEEALQRIRQRDLIRNRKRRLDPGYNEKQIERKRAWREKNAQRHRETSRAYEAKQRVENLQRRLSKNLRGRISKAMMRNTQGVSAVRDLGMTILEFRDYMESRFSPGMTWGNYGEWHIDHIMPLKSFDLTNVSEARQACHYSNLQPLWAIDNHRKWCKPRPETWPENYRIAWEAV